MKATGPCSRRAFLARIALGTSGIVLGQSHPVLMGAPHAPMPPVALFSKVYQELNLGFEETAEMTADCGLGGIDCPVRPNGQVLPERVTEDLPKLAELLQKRGARILLLTTAIQSTASPHAESVLRTARKLGVRQYRLGYWHYRSNAPQETQLNEIKEQLKDLASLNQELGMCAVFQNHAGANLVGAKVRDLFEIASAFPPEQFGIAFDIGHALNELPETWKSEFNHLRSHFRVAYVKDWKRGEGFVPFGEGEIGGTDFFKLVKEAQTSAPISMHTEYEWSGKGVAKTRPALQAALRRDLKVLKNWWAAA